MAKVKERKSESWKPGVLHDDGYISKNKKRKDKRMSLNLSAKKMDTDEFIPIKKSMLAFGKAKQNSAKFVSPSLDKKQTPKKKDTPVSALPGKKQNNSSTPNPRKLSLAASGTPKVKPELADTPKKKVEVTGTPKTKPELASASKNKAPFVGTPKGKIEPAIKSSLKKKAQKFIDHEAEEGEEPITDKNVKPYEKGQKRKSISFKFDDEKPEESDSDESDDSDDSDELTDARDFFDHEASEGEETDDNSDVDEASDVESGSEEEDDDDDDEDEDDVEDEETGEDSDLFKSFVDGEEIDETDDEDDEEESDEDEEESDEDEEEKPPKIQEKKKPDNKTKVKSEPAPSAPINPSKKAKVEKPVQAKETPAKKSEPQTKIVQKDTKQETKPKVKKAEATSQYSGYIKYLPTSITVDKLKAQLSTEISPENIVSIVLKKNNSRNSNKCLVYVTDEDSLDKLENKTFTIGENTFKVFKARETKKLVKTKPLAFLPRVPLSIDGKKIESLIAADVGAENIVKVKNKGINNKLKNRNVLVEFANEEILKKIIFKGSYTCDGTEIVVRQAFESGFQIPIYKVVFSGVPEKANEAIIKKAVEAKVGQGSVINVKFSFNKRSFAFVSLHTEQAQKKLLEPGTEISIKGTKLQILEFKPRIPKKRAPSKKKAKDGPAAKKQKTDDSSSSSVPPTADKTKNKNKPTKPAAQPDSSSAKPQTQKQKKQSLKPVQNDAQKSSPKKQKPQQQQQQSKSSPSPPAKNKKAKKAQNENQVPDKKANLSNKLEAKKNKLKDKKMKKKQANKSE